MDRGVRIILAPPNLHRIERLHALKIHARRAEYSLTENVASPFQAEPRHEGKLLTDILRMSSQIGSRILYDERR